MTKASNDVIKRLNLLEYEYALGIIFPLQVAVLNKGPFHLCLVFTDVSSCSGACLFLLCLSPVLCLYSLLYWKGRYFMNEITARVQISGCSTSSLRRRPVFPSEKVASFSGLGTSVVSFSSVFIFCLRNSP